ncbi:hypothetical protein B0H17DRAFT_638095 [Mycena rosella]|uniref:Uncharacterized protein n=1 Tax=Mycena rosella TaxID=1033263 RepID=A0AAD7DG44_MYCRO|nr:hypothetical protein B0H17DRAFT_638095 [Mycena rosella]
MPPQRADTAHIAPYLSHLITHHGQLTLVPPDNNGRRRKAKENKSSRSTPREEPVRFNSGPTPASPSSARCTRRPSRTEQQYNNCKPWRNYFMVCMPTKLQQWMISRTTRRPRSKRLYRLPLSLCVQVPQHLDNSPHRKHHATVITQTQTLNPMMLPSISLIPEAIHQLEELQLRLCSRPPHLGVVESLILTPMIRGARLRRQTSGRTDVICLSRLSGHYFPLGMFENLAPHFLPRARLPIRWPFPAPLLSFVAPLRCAI